MTYDIDSESFKKILSKPIEITKGISPVLSILAALHILGLF
jgi:hypothetical protein